MRKDRSFHQRTVEMMPFPTLDAAFWAGVDHFEHPRAVSIYLRATKWLSRTVRGSLTDTEFAVMGWVIEYTVGEQRPFLSASYEDISKGNSFVGGKQMSAV
jgi:hypothetical protein